MDTQELLREEFRLRPRSRFNLVEIARERQGVVIALGIIVALAVLAGLHQFVTARNATAVTSGPAVPLSDITDLGSQPNDTAPLPMPDLKFQYDGNPKAMQTFIVEPGAVTPPDVAAQQAAAAQAAAAQKTPGAAKTDQPPGNRAAAQQKPPTPQPQPAPAAPRPH